MSEPEPREDGQLVDKTALDGLPVEQAYAAHQLRMAGHDWVTIAEQVGYANAKTAEVCVRQYLQTASIELAHEKRLEALQLELGRIDALTAAYWPTALAGEVKHAEFVLKAIQTRARLLGFEELHQKTGQSTKTIVIAAGDSYASQLRQLVEGEQ